MAEIGERPALPAGRNERFAGYGIIGLPFQSGHVVAMRRFPASSIGPAYGRAEFVNHEMHAGQ